jgi:hypothetical protein
LIVSLPYTGAIELKRRLTMREEKQSERVAVGGKEVFVRIDVHKGSWQVTVRTAGEEVFHGRIASDYRVFRRILNRFGGSRIKVRMKPVLAGLGYMIN